MSPELETHEMGASVEHVAVERIHVTGWNPRTDFNEEGMAELARSVQAHGIIEPLVVRPAPDGEPWSYDYVRQLISDEGKKYYPGYHPYLARHFCATYRLMESYRRTGVWDIVGVSRFMDHRGKRGRGIEVTMGYVHIAQRMMDEHMKKRRVSRVSPRVMP